MGAQDTDGLIERVAAHIGAIWPELDASDRVRRAQRFVDAIGVTPDAAERPPERDRLRWSEDDVALITYGDSVVDGDHAPLAVLADVLDHEFADAFGVVHVLPFSPSSSDRGFAVVDYDAVDPALGGWDDIARLADRHRLMADLVANHASADSQWFDQFRRSERPGRDYFVTADPDADLSAVVRPRSQPLLTEVDTPDGTRWAWTTFGPDQVDLDWSNPELVCEMLAVIDRYLAAGVSLLRLDAIAFLWKEPGTSCIHLPATHEFVKMIRTLLEWREPAGVILTETNVPDRENRSYFGDGDEAHLVYNFPLPPLIVHAILTETPDILAGWLEATPAPPAGCTMFSFLSSHDGIGLRPAEGILDDDAIAGLVEIAHERGGLHGSYDREGAPAPYELNIALPDLFGGATDPLMPERILLAHSLILVLRGVPAVYVNSVLATTNAHDSVDRTGVRREINRPSVLRDRIPSEVDGSWRSVVTAGLLHRCRVRRRAAALHPDGAQDVRTIGAVMGVARLSPDGAQRITGWFNLSGEPTVVDVGGQGRDLLTGLHCGGRLELGPFGDAWVLERMTTPASGLWEDDAGARPGTTGGT